LVAAGLQVFYISDEDMAAEAKTSTSTASGLWLFRL